MLTIALDESTGFEKNAQKRGPVFVAGLIYDDKGNEEDRANERKRVTEYLKRVCQKTGHRYPRDLHLAKAGSRNGGAVHEVKAEINASMAEFMRAGTYEGEPVRNSERVGKYYLFAIVKSRRGKQDFFAGNASNLLKEDVAGNLYAHMTYDIVSRLIFHNPVIEEINDVQLDLPTRVVVLENAGKAEENYQDYLEYERLGYKLVEQYSDESNKVLQVANFDGYRAAIQREMLETGRSDIHIQKLGVNSIVYESDKKGKMAYLYLADAICSYYSDYANETDSCRLLDSFYELAHKINGSDRNLIFAYDTADAYFHRAWKAYESGDLFEALSICFDARGECLPFYKRRWFPVIEQTIIDNQDANKLRIAVLKLSALATSKNLNQQKLLHIFKILEESASSGKDRGPLDKSAVFDLYAAGIDAFNHIADTENAERCFAHCRQSVRYTSIENYLAVLNRQSVYTMDRLEFEKARQISEEALEYAKELLALKRMLYGDDSVRSIEYGRICSQYGQACAALHDMKAEELFLTALDAFDADSADYYITLSYFLHYCIAMGRKEKYDEYAKKYFGGNEDREKQFHYLLTAGKDAPISFKFALFVFVKALYIFDGGKATPGLKTELLAIEKTLRRFGLEGEITGHPWEIIYKYLAFIAKRNGRKDIAERYIEMTKSTELFGAEHEKLIDWIISYGLLQYKQLTEDADKSRQEELELWRTMGNDDCTDSQYVQEELAKRFTFMYV